MTGLTHIQVSLIAHLSENGWLDSFSYDDLGRDSAGCRLEMPYSVISVRNLMSKGFVVAAAYGRFRVTAEARELAERTTCQKK